MPYWLSRSFWFNFHYFPLNTWSKIGLITVVIVSILGAVALFVWSKNWGIYRYVLRQLRSFLVTNAILGAIGLLFFYEQTPFFTARFWFLLWFLIDVVWLVIIIRALKKIPQKKKAKEADDVYRKYLPS
jgi:uncharacterized membrane protein YeaQ/YmgE (transglycosylase-associated protein family)